MSQNRNNPRRPRYRRHRKHAKWFQEFLDRESARYLGQATQVNVAVVNTDFEFAATVSGSSGPYRIVGVSPAELTSLDQFYIRPFDAGGTDKAAIYGSVQDIGPDRKITFASRDLSPDFTSTFGTNTLTSAAHGMSTGDGPFRVTTDGVLPDGISVSTDYYAIVTDANDFKAAVSVDATASGVAISLADDGSGTHSIDFAFTIEQDMTPEGILDNMARGISRERIREGIATASGILEVFA